MEVYTIQLLGNWGDPGLGAKSGVGAELWLGLGGHPRPRFPEMARPPHRPVCMHTNIIESSVSMQYTAILLCSVTNLISQTVETLNATPGIC